MLSPIEACPPPDPNQDHYLVSPSVTDPLHTNTSSASSVSALDSPKTPKSKPSDSPKTSKTRVLRRSMFARISISGVSNTSAEDNGNIIFEDEDEDDDDDDDDIQNEIFSSGSARITNDEEKAPSSPRRLKGTINAMTGDLSESSRTRTNSEFGGSSISAIMKIDAHGRLVAQKLGNVEEKESKEAIKQYNERLLKWTSMMRHWDRYATCDKSTGFVVSLSEKVRSRTRKGIPDAVRAHVYMLMLDSERLKAGKEKLFEELATKKKLGIGPWDEVIRRDIHRTNPDHIMFMQKEGAGQEALFRVLRAYSLHDEEVGYCQGMGFFVSVMLTYVPEEDAFWLLVGLLSKHSLRDMYMPSLIGMRRSFFVMQKLLQATMPKLSKHLEKNDFSAPLYASRWFGTLYSADFPIEVTLRIWDILVAEGPKILYQVGLAIMKRCKKDLKMSSFDEFPAILREFARSVQPEDMIQEALKSNIKQKNIDLYGKKFDELEAKLAAGN